MVRDGLDLSAPACLLIGYLLHFYPAGAARDLVAKYASALPPGSCVKEVTGFFGPLELVPPGVVDARQWHQDREPAALPPRAGFVFSGVARKR